jgi:hypothetical protein
MFIREFKSSSPSALRADFNRWSTQCKKEDAEVVIIDKLFTSNRWENNVEYVLLIFYEGDGGKDV